jgi:hypothetical protein
MSRLKSESIPTGKIRRIHIIRRHVSLNKEDGKKRPVYAIKHGGETVYARSLAIQGPSVCVSDEGGALWIETNAQLDLFGAMTYKDVKKAFSDAVLED